MSRFVIPETIKLEISQGDWLLVKRRLTAGEERHAFARILKPTTIGEKLALDLERTGLQKIVAYLLDWSLEDHQGRIVAVRDQPADVVERAILDLEPSSFQEIHAAIVAHETAQAVALEAEKKARDGATRSSPTYTSVA